VRVGAPTDRLTHEHSLNPADLTMPASSSVTLSFSERVASVARTNYRSATPKLSTPLSWPAIVCAATWRRRRVSVCVCVYERMEDSCTELCAIAAVLQSLVRCRRCVCSGFAVR
jgi:hypothetical protein